MDQPDIGVHALLDVLPVKLNALGSNSDEKERDIMSMAIAQPKAATMILYSPLHTFQDMTKFRCIWSATSTMTFMTS